jgi:flagellar motor switch protein FliN/FliY
MAEKEPEAGEMDDWAAALAEQETAAIADAEASKANIFQPLTGDLPPGSSRDIEMILDIPVQMTVELGRTKLPIKGLLELAPGSVVELDGIAGEPMDIYVNGCLIAKGEVVVVNDRFGIRITDVITPSERIRKLNR